MTAESVFKLSADEGVVGSQLLDLKDVFFSQRPGQRRSVADRIRVGGAPARPEIYWFS